MLYGNTSIISSDLGANNKDKRKRRTEKDWLNNTTIVATWW